MEYCILMGSPRKNGNTSALLKPFAEELGALGARHTLTWLHDKRIEPCVACRLCQRDWSAFGCRHDDDMPEIFDAILACDVLVLATPIYSWYCTPPMKAALDRLVYGMNKYYGDEKGPSLWKGKRLALVTTCGYPPEKGADLWEAGVKRYCKHSRLLYAGMLAERHSNYRSAFMDEEKERRARAFAQQLYYNVL
ncbi:MAG: flavodoxin family protein [Clostridiales Family XIII bacterium]|jgi:multimeric flavodoxin WrbA|nr:flavodoxin family protein [Clostridiales Family XIII bacterium]